MTYLEARACVQFLTSVVNAPRVGWVERKRALLSIKRVSWARSIAILRRKKSSYTSPLKYLAMARRKQYP